MWSLGLALVLCHVTLLTSPCRPTDNTISMLCIHVYYSQRWLGGGGGGGAGAPAHDVKRDVVVDGEHAVVDVLIVESWQRETGAETLLQTGLVARLDRRHAAARCTHARHTLRLLWQTFRILPSTPKTTILIPDEGWWRRRRLRHCNRVAVEQKFNTWLIWRKCRIHVLDHFISIRSVTCMQLYRCLIPKFVNK